MSQEDAKHFRELAHECRHKAERSSATTPPKRGSGWQEIGLGLPKKLRGAAAGLRGPEQPERTSRTLNS